VHFDHTAALSRNIGRVTVAEQHILRSKPIGEIQVSGRLPLNEIMCE
jgi:hypothetical protein